MQQTASRRKGNPRTPATGAALALQGSRQADWPLHNKSTSHMHYVPLLAQRTPPCVPQATSHTVDQAFTASTTQREDFTAKSTLVVRPHPPTTVHTSKEPFEGATTARSTYVAHPLTLTRSVQQHADAVTFGGDKNVYETSNQAFFVPLASVRQKPVKPMEGGTRAALTVKHSEAAKSLYSQEFLPLPLEKPAAAKVLGASLHPIAGVPMACTTTSHDDYAGRHTEPRRPVAPQKSSITIGRGRAFLDSTTTRSAFTSHNVAPVKSFQPSQLHRDTQPAPFDGCSTQRDDFKAWELTPVKSYAPQQKRIATKGSFDHTTLHQQEYVRYASARAAPMAPSVATLRPEGTMQWDTTYASQMQGWTAERAVATKTLPRPGLTLPKGAFAGATVYREEFQPKSTERVAPVAPLSATAQLSMSQSYTDFSTEAHSAYTVPYKVEQSIADA